MPYLMGLLAVALFGADATPASKPDAVLTYHVKTLEMEGLEWRTSLYPDLQPVTRQACATVWTTSAKAATTLVEKSHRVTSKPVLSVVPGQTASISQAHTRKILTDVTRTADGPVNHASNVTFDETISDAKEGFTLSLRGRKIDQGVLTTMVLNDKQVTAVHPVTFTEKAKPKGAWDPETVKATIQVPEMSQCEVAGEWLIPNDGVLIVSMGVHTVADSSGKAVVRERLAVIEASESQPKPATKAVFYSKSGPADASSVLPTKGYINTPVSVTATMNLAPPLNLPPLYDGHDVQYFSRFTPLPWDRSAAGKSDSTTPPTPPSLPSRHLPEGRNAAGEPVPLPPLPEGTPITMLPGTSTPCATPQHKSTTDEPDTVTAQSKLDTKVEESSVEPKSTAKTFTFRLPMSGGLVVEIKAVAVGAKPD